MNDGANNNWVVGLHYCYRGLVSKPILDQVYKNGSVLSSGTFATTGGNYTHTTATNADTLGTYSSTSTGVPNNTVYCIDGGMAEFAVWKKCSPLETQPLLEVALAR